MKSLGEVEILRMIEDQRIILECSDIAGYLKKGCWLEFKINGSKILCEVVELECVTTVSGAKKGPFCLLNVNSEFDILNLKEFLIKPVKAIVKK